MAFRQRGLLAALAAVTIGVTTSMPVQMTLNQLNMECVYEQLDEGEYVTMGLFVLMGAELTARMHIEGPFADLEEVTSGFAMNEALQKWEKHDHTKHRAVELTEDVSFEHLSLGAFRDEDDDYVEEEASREESVEERRERRARERKKALERRQQREQHKMQQRKKVRSEGEPILKTLKAPLPGWYRFCAKGNFVTVELEVRKESETGGIDKHGHVRSFAQKALEEEESLLEHDTAAEEGITDEDFNGAREKLKSLRKILADIQSKQTQERHRLIVHAATNEHSHSRMVLSSLLETVLFMAVTGFQVYTIRKWFKGAPVLGR